MANLKSLIRVRKHVVEQKQKFLAELYRQAEELENQKTTMLNQMKKEQETLKEMPAEMIGFFGAYSEAVKARVEDIEDAQKKLETRITIAQDDMRDAFGELRKIELIQEKRDREEAAERAKKQMQEMDEIGLGTYRNQQEDETV